MKETKNNKINEFHLLNPVEKIWWTRYTKLKTIWEELYPEKEFPAELGNGPLLSKPWEDRFNPLNDQLTKARDIIEEEMIDWERIQVQNEFIFCNYDKSCDDCRYRFKCEIKK